MRKTAWSRRRLGAIAVLCVVLSRATRAFLLGDINCDGAVDGQDVTALTARLFGDTDSNGPDCTEPDTNGDGVVSAADLVGVLQLLQPPGTPTATPTPPSGPRITFLGLAAADGTIIAPVADDTAAFQRVGGSGFQLVVEALPGTDGLQVGTVVFDSRPDDPQARPDLQIEASRPLGDGNPGVCTEGGIPGFDPPDFGPTREVADALNDFSCGFEVATTARRACTTDGFGSPVFVSQASGVVQFCLLVNAVKAFPPGETALSVLVRDVGGNLGPEMRIAVRIGNQPFPTLTATRTSTATPTTPQSPSPTRTLTVYPSFTLTPSSTGATETPTPTGTPSLTPSPSTTAATATRTRTATVTPTGSPSPTPSSSVTGTRLKTPTPTSTPNRPSATPSATVTGTRATTTPTATATRSASPTPSLTNSPLATASATPPASASGTATFSKTPTPTATSTATRTATPTRTQTGTRTPTPTPTVTRTPTLTKTPTATPSTTTTRTQTNTRTFTLTPTVTPTPTITLTPTATVPPEPIITFFGVAYSDGTLIPQPNDVIDGIPIYERPSFGFWLIVEGRPAPTRVALGSSTFNWNPDDPTVLPDLQIEVSNSLGKGSADVCDDPPSMLGGVPAVDPPDFSVKQSVADAINDFACRFGDEHMGITKSGDACTLFFPEERYHFVNSTSTIQYCGLIDKPFGFPAGVSTLVTVRIRDISGHLSNPARLMIRVAPS